MANVYGTFQTYCNEHSCCDDCDRKVRFLCKVKNRIEELQSKIIKTRRETK